MEIKEMREKELDLTLSLEEAAITVDLYVDRLIDIFEEETNNEAEETLQGSIMSMFIELIEELKSYAMPDTITKFNAIMLDLKNEGWSFDDESSADILEIVEVTKPIEILDPDFPSCEATMSNDLDDLPIGDIKNVEIA